MKAYTQSQMKLLKSNPYTFKVTQHKLYFTIKFKEDFWIRYQAGFAPKRIITDLGYDVSMFGQKQIDSMVQSIKRQALSGTGFREGESRTNRMPIKEPEESVASSLSIERMQNELLYLKQEVEYLKKISKTDKIKKNC